MEEKDKEPPQEHSEKLLVLYMLVEVGLDIMEDLHLLMVNLEEMVAVEPEAEHLMVL